MQKQHVSIIKMIEDLKMLVWLSPHYSVKMKKNISRSQDSADHDDSFHIQMLVFLKIRDTNSY